MQNLLLYLYNKHIHSRDPHAITLCKQEPLRIYNLNQEQLQFYSTMLIRNFFTYSPALMQIKLSVKHLLGIYRLNKFETIIEENGLNAIWGSWIDNQMMPINYNGKKMQDSKFVYIDYKEQSKKQQKKNQMEQNEAKQIKRKNSKTKQAQKPAPKKHTQSTDKQQTSSKQILNINIVQLTIQLQNRLICSKLHIQPADIKQSQKRLQALLLLQHQKVQQYLNQRFNPEVLMVYNFINKYPYIDQKTLLNKSMLPVVELRRGVAKLISEGWINFYPENSRNMLYKCLDRERIRERCCDNIAQALLNLHIYLDTAQSRKQQMQDEQKIHLVLKSIQKLDDVLMILMA